MGKHNKWKNAAMPALMIHGCIGTVYCWSLFGDAISAKIGDGYQWAFSLAIFFLGLSAAFLGPFVERDARKASRCSAVLFGCGMLLSALACYLESKLLFFLGYGVVMGIGLGLGYLSPVKALMLWFSENKGLATGLAISGFGLAKVLATPSFEYLLNNYGVTTMFLVHGLVYTVVMLVGSSFLRKPAGSEPLEKPRFSFTEWYKKLSEVVKLRGLWLFWVVFYLNITAGLAIISQEKLLFTGSGYGSYIGLALILCAVFNTLGRLCVSWSSDYLKHRWVIFILVLTISSSICLGSMLGFMIMVPLAVLLCNAGYGAMFSTMPCALADRYGLSKVSEVHGIILSAWAFAGLSGNQLSSFVLEWSGGDFKWILIVSGILYGLGMLLSFLYDFKADCSE